MNYNNVIYIVVMLNLSGALRRSCKRIQFFCMIFISGCSLLFAENLSAQEPGTDDEIPARTVTSADIKRGERLFRGLLPLGPDAASCASCHNPDRIDTFNWNPSAYEIARLYLDRDVEALRSVVNEPASAMMMEMHTGYDLSEENLFMIKAWMDEFSRADIVERPIVSRTLFFILLVLLLAGALADLIIFRKIPFKLVHLVVILGTGYFIVDMIAFEAVSLGRSPYYQPEQPIKFSHEVHVTGNRTDCLYCHSTAEYSKTPGIPSTSNCMNCHIIIREGTNSGRFEINKLVAAYENQQPIRWVKVYSVPDHVHFSHNLHVGASGIDCAECHGDVEHQHRVMQVHDLSMGWCLDCHRETEVNITGNEFYSNYHLLREDLREGGIEMVTARETGGTDCMKCHY
jgi:cytochrome c553